MKKQPTVALIYDFDGTLAPGNMQEYSFIEELKMTPKQFWGKSTQLSKEQDASGILCYMKLMLDEAEHAGISVKRESFVNYGKTVELFNGVNE